MNKSLWNLSEQNKQESLLEDFSKFINLKSNHSFKTLWNWSVDHPEEFWSKFWDYSKIIGDKGNEVIKYNKIFKVAAFSETFRKQNFTNKKRKY